MAEQTVALGRSKRATAGNRMRELLEKAHQEDDDELFKEVEDDEEFEAPPEVRDVYLDEFADTDEEVEHDEEAMERELLREERRKAKGKSRVSFNPLASLPRAKRPAPAPLHPVSTPDTPGGADVSGASSSNPLGGGVGPSLLDIFDPSTMAPSTLLLAQRKQRRDAKRLQRSEARRSVLRASTLRTEQQGLEGKNDEPKRKGRKALHEGGEVRGVRHMTQAELIAAALDQEERNKEELAGWLRREEERRELRRVGRKRVKGPRWTWVSRTVGKPVVEVAEDEARGETTKLGDGKRGLQRPAPAPIPTPAPPTAALPEKSATPAPAAPSTLQEDSATPTPAPAPATASPEASTTSAPASASALPDQAVSPVAVQAVTVPEESATPAPTAAAAVPEESATPAVDSTPVTPATPDTLAVAAPILPEDTSAPVPTPVLPNAPSTATPVDPQPPVPPPAQANTTETGAATTALATAAPPTQTDAANAAEPDSAPTTGPYTRNYLILSSIPGGLPAELSIILGAHVDWASLQYIPARNRPINRRPPLCPFTGQVARYKHPRTGVGYATKEGYRLIEALTTERYVWDAEGFWAGGEGDVGADGVDGVTGWKEAVCGGWSAGQRVQIDDDKDAIQEQPGGEVEVEVEAQGEEGAEEGDAVQAKQTSRAKKRKSSLPVDPEDRPPSKKVKAKGKGKTKR